MSKYAIEVDNLNLKYRFVRNMSIKQEIIKLVTQKDKEQRVKEVWALKDITFQVEKGQTVGIIGANGAGKTTLLKVLAKIFQPDSGHVSLMTDSVSLLTLGAGFQNELSGVENIYLNGLILGLSRQQIDKKLEDIISFSGIDDFVYNPLKTYSAGMRARLAFSIACHVEPDILLIDEVLGVGDEAFKQKSNERIRELINDNRTVMLVSHSLPVVRNMCDKVLWLENGELMAFGNTNEVVKEYLEFIKSKS